MEPLIVVAIALVMALWFVYRRSQKAEDRRSDELLQVKLAELHDKAMHESRSTERRPNDWSVRREYVLRRDGYKCTKCQSTSTLQVHHVVPVSKRIDHSVANLTTLCVHCHADEEGHGQRIVHAARAARAVRLRYDERKARADYRCSNCGMNLLKGAFVGMPMRE